MSHILDEGDRSVPALPPLPSTYTFGQMMHSVLNRQLILGSDSVSSLSVVDYPSPVTWLSRNIGLTHYSSEWRGTGGRSSTRSWGLIAATVGEKSYGSFVTNIEGHGGAVSAEVSVGPNPTTGLVTIRSTAGLPRSVHVEVLDLLGRRVGGSPPRAYPGPFAIQIDLSDLPPGAYVVRTLLDGTPASSTVVTRASGR